MDPIGAHSLPGCCSSPEAIIAVAAQHNLQLLDEAGVKAARGLAAQLVPGAVAPAHVFQAVQGRAGAAVFGYFEAGRLSALLAAFPLNEKGHAQLVEGAFNAIDLDLTTIAVPGETPAAYYGWGFAAASKDGGRAVVKASAQIHRELFWATPTYARAVTSDGLRALSAIGFTQVDASEPALLWIAPRAAVASR